MQIEDYVKVLVKRWWVFVLVAAVVIVVLYLIARIRGEWRRPP